jgi:adenylosuccinate synthase
LNAYIVLDLGFGDSGKGLLTDFLVRHTGARIVVRYNGGAQAGHNVVTAEGAHHTFAQFGAGSLVPGVTTLISRHVVVHPTALLVEARTLRERGVPDVFGRIRISERARITTPYHQAGGRIRELARGASRHGSCGVGVGETVKDALEYPEDAILAGDLRDVARLRRQVRRIRERKRDELQGLAAQASGDPCLEQELSLFERDAIIEDWIEAAASLASGGLIVPDSTLLDWAAREGTVVFEGAQGVLLDEWWGFHPFTTWSCCTAANATELLDEWAPGARAERIGVLRAHMTRHGPGPLPTETDVFREAVFDHNRQNQWQGPVRYGWFDAVLARYALERVGGVDALAVTHLDAVPRMSTWKACRGYRLDPRPSDAELIAGSTADGLVTRLITPAGHSLALQARMAEMLVRAGAVFEECEPHEGAVLGLLERLLERRVDIVSRGPRAKDVAFRRRSGSAAPISRLSRYDPRDGEGRRVEAEKESIRCEPSAHR